MRTQYPWSHKAVLVTVVVTTLVTVLVTQYTHLMAYHLPIAYHLFIERAASVLMITTLVTVTVTMVTATVLLAI